MKNKKMIIITVVLSVCIVIAGGFLLRDKGDVDNGSKDTNNKKPIVAVSIMPEEAFVEAVCKDTVEVVTIIPPGGSPANYEPTPQEMMKVNKSDIYFPIGVPAEKSNILENVNGAKIIYLNEEVAKKYEELKFESGGRDPHIWLSPKRVIVMINKIAEEMGKINIEYKDEYKKNADEYIDKLKNADDEIKKSLEGATNKEFIVYHPAFGYLADEYGMKMLSLEEEGKEATPKHVKEMIDLAKKEKIKVIFYQEEIDSTQSKSFAEEIGGETTMLSPLDKDYINNLKKMADTIKAAFKE